MIKIKTQQQARLFFNTLVAYKVTENEDCRFGYVHYDLFAKECNATTRATKYEDHGNKPYYKESDLKPENGILQLASIYKVGVYPHDDYLNFPPDKYTSISMRSMTIDEARALAKEMDQGDMRSTYNHGLIKALLYNKASHR